MSTSFKPDPNFYKKKLALVSHVPIKNSSFYVIFLFLRVQIQDKVFSRTTICNQLLTRNSEMIELLKDVYEYSRKQNAHLASILETWRNDKYIKARQESAYNGTPNYLMMGWGDPLTRHIKDDDSLIFGVSDEYEISHLVIEELLFRVNMLCTKMKHQMTSTSNLNDKKYYTKLCSLSVYYSELFTEISYIFDQQNTIEPVQSPVTLEKTFQNKISNDVSYKGAVLGSATIESAKDQISFVNETKNSNGVETENSNGVKTENSNDDETENSNDDVTENSNDVTEDDVEMHFCQVGRFKDGKIYPEATALPESSLGNYMKYTVLLFDNGPIFVSVWIELSDVDKLVHMKYINVDTTQSVSMDMITFRMFKESNRFDFLSTIQEDTLSIFMFDNPISEAAKSACLTGTYQTPSSKLLLTDDLDCQIECFIEGNLSNKFQSINVLVDLNNEIVLKKYVMKCNMYDVCKVAMIKYFKFPKLIEVKLLLSKKISDTCVCQLNEALLQEISDGKHQNNIRTISVVNTRDRKSQNTKYVMFKNVFDSYQMK